MSARSWMEWPVYRQLSGGDRLGRRADAVASKRTRDRRPRVATADQVVKSICPYCAVGCGQNVYVKDDQVIQIEGDPDSPVSRGRLCPKGSASLQLTTGDGPRVQRAVPPAARHRLGGPGPRHGDGHDRRPGDRRPAVRLAVGGDGARARRTLGIASLGGATLDNEENYLIKKLFTALGAIQIENQARI